MKLCHIGKYFHPVTGGIESHVKDIVDAFGGTVIVSNTQNITLNEQYSCKLVKKISNIIRVARQASLFSLPINVGLFSEIKKQSSDIYHVHLPNPMAVLSYLLAKPPGKLVVTWHSDIIRQRFFMPLYRPFLNAFLNKASAIIVTSSQYLESSPYLTKFKNKCQVIPLGIDFKSFESVSKNHGMTTRKRPIFLFVGRLVSYKGISYLIEAAKGLDADFRIVGDGPLRTLAMQAPDNVTFVGRVDDVKKEIANCDIFVLPSISRAEAFGIVQLEAIAMKKPVISTTLGTGVEFVNAKGVLVPPKDVVKLHEVLSDLIDHPQKREFIAKESYQYAKEVFDLKKMYSSLEKLYAGLMK